jgi:hypothetical protein
MTNVEELRQRLYEWCGRSVACKRAADYYIMRLQNPCYPPAARMTYDQRKYYMKIIETYGHPPQCDIKALVLERLRGTPLEKYIDEIAELAELIRKRLHVTSRVAAAVATIIVAERHGRVVIYGAVAEQFGVSYAAVRTWLKRAHELYIDNIAAKKL